MKQIFDQYVETSFDGYSQASFKFEQFRKNYQKYFPHAVGSKVLDIGIGRGEMLSSMKNWGYTYQGVDISPSTVRFCSGIGLNCEVTEDTSKWLNARPEEFNLITCLDVVEHVPREHVVDFLSAMRKALKLGGVAIIQVPNLQSPFGYLHHFNDITHVSGFVEHSLAQVLKAAGFEKFEFHGFEEQVSTSLRATVKRGVRWVYRKVVRILRAINSNPNPSILDPVMFAVAYRR